MHYEIITALNTELFQKYAQRSLKTWQDDPVIYWQDQSSDPRWDLWRSAARMRETARFEHTCVRFSYKVQAQIQHLRNSQADYVIWLDADVVQRQTYSPEQFASWMPRDNELFTYLDRNPIKYSETGWIAYNRRHPRLLEFVDAFENIYLSREIFSLEQWHDAFVWDYIRKSGNYPARNLLHNPKSSEPFDNSELAPWLRHHKGQRKTKI